LEQFALGGVYSVRGYSQDALLTDNGFFASAEVRIALLRVKQGVLQAAPFLDVGVGWNHPDNPLPTPEDHTLLGIGLGMQWQMGDRFSLRLDWGIPLLGEDNGGDSLQEQGLYFSLNYRLF
jgi:hemolysin activation/secretion protein